MRDPIFDHMAVVLENLVGALDAMSKSGSPHAVNMAPARERLRQMRAAYEEANPPPEPTKAELRQQAKDAEAENG